MRTSRSGRTLAIALLAAFGVGGLAHAAGAQVAVPQGATVRRSQDATLADANATTAAAPQAQRATTSTTATPISAANYVPKTKYDNTPYRFNAGKRFTAAEFDAWMKSRGIRVAKGAPAAGAPATTPAPQATANATTTLCSTPQATGC